MKKLLFLLFPIIVNSQIGYKAISNLVNANEKANTIDIGFNYEFKNQQVQLMYNFTSNYFAFGTYNIKKSTDTYYSLFGGERKVDNNNLGYSVGVGKQKIVNLRNFKNTELLLGIESQKFETKEYSASYKSEEKDILKQNFYKIFAQFNMMKNRTNYDYGYSFKLSYFKITSYNFKERGNYSDGLEKDFTGKSTLMIDPTINFNYKLLKNKNLLLTSQVGFSSMLWPIRNYKSLTGSTGLTSSSKESKFYFSPILKLGIQYRINLKNSK